MSGSADVRGAERRSPLQQVLLWFDSWADDGGYGSDSREIVWLRVVPFVALHLGCLAVLWVGWSPIAVGVAAAFYFVRMFAITGFYHRYFSHRSFQTSRPMQFLFALLGATAIQRGALWWASHHRAHHRHSDEPADRHSPVQDSFVSSHIGWILEKRNFRSRLELVPDLAKYPELRFLDRYDVLVPLLMLPAFWALGALLEAYAPGFGTSGVQMLVWGFGISTVVLYHCTFSINSLAHRVGTRRFETDDDSRNNWWLALVTLGEGWHNNHHHYQASVRQGFRWWEVDITYYLLRAMESCGLIWKLRPVPARVLAEARAPRERSR
jgi:stearoyl-CoA desaturase (delta-9 desaturase)